jgi:hypothetical protein
MLPWMLPWLDFSGSLLYSKRHNALKKKKEIFSAGAKATGLPPAAPPGTKP